MTVAKRKNIRTLLLLMKLKGYKVYDKPYQLNIVGVRNNSALPNKFDDILYAFWKDDKDKWNGSFYTITTDPGTYWLKNPMNKLGAAILKNGQYIDAYTLGLHRGEYKALIEQKPVTVIRDYDRNALLDFNNGKEDTGNFGINIHRAGSKGTTINVDRWSAGCQVFENADDFANFLGLAEKHKGLYGNNFTYTLVDERAYTRSLRRRSLYVVGLIGVGILGFILYKKLKRK
jgi:hypothetical protein